MNQERASKLARNGFESLEAKEYEKAEALYREAFTLADPNHWAIQDYHGELSLVLRALGKTEKALEQLELSLAAALRASDQPTDFNVTIARHFLGEYLVELGEFEKAVSLLSPFVGTGCEKEWLLSFPIVRIHLRRGRVELAQEAIRKALSNTPGEDHAEVKEKFKNLANEETANK